MNKPVAWISRLPEGDVYNCAWAEKQNDDDIPLYTHPVKELTDEEIIIELNKRKFDWVATTSTTYIIESSEIKEFAKAILRKAQEK